MRELLRKLEQEHDLTRGEFTALLRTEDSAVLAELRERAVRVRKEHFGDQVYIRGLIEFTNYCRNDCYYCGIRRSNRHAARYRLSSAEILECCRQGDALGFRTFVLQGGEDGWFTPEKTADLVASIKNAHPDCAVTLSVGEYPKEVYRLWREAGADRYLLRHETADEAHYRQLHPPALSGARRKACLWDLKELGYQVGTGFMVGSPYQTAEHLAEDLRFIRELQPEMVGIGPYLPHRDTPFADRPAGSAGQTLKLLSILRLMLPEALLPATTALGTAAADGREQGILAGANVVMPNLSPVSVREKYMLYDNKASSGSEAAEGLEDLKRRMQNIGYRVVVSRGDHPGRDQESRHSGEEASAEKQR